MSSDEWMTGLAKLGRRRRGDRKGRSTPIPVAPPRVPTPIPVKGVELSQEGRKTAKTCLNDLKIWNFEERTSSWTNLRKVNLENIYPYFAETSNDLNHHQLIQACKTQNRAKDKQKLDVEKLSEYKKRFRGKWPPNEGKRDKGRGRDETVFDNIASPFKTSQRNLNQFIGENDISTSVTLAAVESSRVAPASFRSPDRSATGINNNFNYKYYGFLDSGDENTNDIPDAYPTPVSTRQKCREFACDNYRDDMAAVRAESDESVRNRKQVSGEKEIVYENLRLESSLVERKSTRSESDKYHVRNRVGEVKRGNHEYLSRRFMEYNWKFGKYENKLNNFSIREPLREPGSFRGTGETCVSDNRYGGLCDGFSYLESKYTYSVSGMPGNLAQSSAAAAFFARASQKLNLSSPHRRKRHASLDDEPSKSAGFGGAIHRTPPPMPPALLRRIGVKEVSGVGKVKVMLKVMGVPSSVPSGNQSFFNVDSRKKQVTLYDPALCGTSAAPEDRRVGVAAPKMFAFDAIFTQDESQAEICSTALTDVIHAVINGTDGCLFCFGHAKLGKTATMLGTPESANTLGAIPCAIYWLFRGIHEQKQKTGARFSVRVSAVEVCQPTQQLKDLLAGHANDCEQSPGVYLRDDPLFGTQLQNQSELRVPNAEKAAFYLDAAVNSRSGKEDVAGGRSRLHLIDLGSCDKGKANGGIPLSGLGNVLLAIFNGQKHLPYREHKITQLLKECLSSLTCHAAMIAHVSQNPQQYTDTLTTIQLASRIHRMRRRKIKFGGPSGPSGLSNGSSSDELSRHNASTGSSDFDPSSSEQSADTVIYVAPNDDAATDGEHPPVYLLNLNPMENRCAMNKIPRNVNAEVRPGFKAKTSSPAKSIASHKTTEENSAGSPLHKVNKTAMGSAKSSPVRNAGNKSTVKPNWENHGKSTVSTNSPQLPRHEEHWIDGPRVSKQKVAEARNFLLKENSKKETWIDGPMQKPSKTTGGSGNYGFMDSHKKTMIRKWVENQSVHLKQALGNSPRTELASGLLRSSEPIKDEDLTSAFGLNYEELSERQVEGSADVVKPEAVLSEETKPNFTVGTAVIKQTDVCFKELNKLESEKFGTNCGESSESSEEEKLPPPPLPLVLRYGKDINIGKQKQPINVLGIQGAIIEDYDDDDEIELEIVEVTELDEPVPMQDSCLQVTEEDIAMCMGEEENPLPEVDQENNDEHPLRILSQENLTVVSTFTDSMSVATDLDRCLPRPRYGPPSLFDDPFHPNGPYFHDEYIDLITKNQNSLSGLEQLARLHELYKSKMVTSNATARCQSLSLCDVFDDDPGEGKFISGNCSTYSEPAYRLPCGDSESVCTSCKKTMSKEETEEKVQRSQKGLEKLPASSKKSISSLRQPDGASNPNLESKVSENAPPKSDADEENKEKNLAKKKLTNGEHKRGNSCSPSRKLNHYNATKAAHEEKPADALKGTDLIKLNESNIKVNNSPTRNTNSSSRGELRRTNSANTNKSRRIEESEDVTKSGTPPPASSSSPLTQKHLYFNKTCPSNEGSDSGHESNVSPKITKLGGRPRPQAQCESSGYESVVSFTSSLDSEVGVKLVREETEEIHDPGGQPGWWCWCVSGRPTTVQGSRRQSERRSTPGRGPLTVPPKSGHLKN